MQAKWRVQQVGDTVRNCQAKAEPLAVAAVAAMEFLEHDALLFRGNTRAAVMHADGQRVAIATYAEQYAAAAGVADGVGEEILQHPA